MISAYISGKNSYISNRSISIEMEFEKKNTQKKEMASSANYYSLMKMNSYFYNNGQISFQKPSNKEVNVSYIQLMVEQEDGAIVVFGCIGASSGAEFLLIDEIMNILLYVQTLYLIQFISYCIFLMGSFLPQHVELFLYLFLTLENESPGLYVP